MTEDLSADAVLDFWFPDNGHRERLARHGAFWDEPMQGGMDAAILDRLDRTDAVVERIIARFPEALAGMAAGFRDQRARVRDKIRRFGRHAHRNPVPGRPSSREELAYIASGHFPHVRKVEAEAGAGP